MKFINRSFVAALAALTAPAALAALIAEEPFLVNFPTNPATGEYTGNGLGGQNPTVNGWSVEWNKLSSNDIIGNPMGLEYPGLASSGGGGSAPDGTRSGRVLNTAYTDATATTIYLSLLLKLDSNDPARYRVFELHSGGYDDGANRKLQLGQAEGDFGNEGFGLRLLNDNSFRLDLGAADTEVNLFVIKFEFSDAADADSITIWRNPDSASFGAPEPVGGQTLSGFNLQFDRTSLAHFGGGKDIHLDEIRIGESWADVTPVGTEPAAVLRYTFDDGTLGDWTDKTPANTNNGPRNWAITTAPSVHPGGNMARHGSHGVGQNLQGGFQDDGHPTLWLRSPKFTLNGNGDLSAWLYGGHGFGADATGKLVADVPANAFNSPGDPTFPSFLGVALRNVNTGVYVLAGSKADPGDFWQKVTFTAAQLEALETANPGHVYTLDLLDVRAGGWGWVSMDSVVIPGDISIDTNTLPTIDTVANISIDWADANPIASPVGPIDIYIDDFETDPADLQLSVSSSNTALVPNANLILGGSGGVRTLEIQPLPGLFSSTTITLTVSDGSDSASTSFLFTVERPEFALNFDFDDATLQGWTTVSGNPSQQVFAVKTHGPLFDSTPGPESGSHLVGVDFGYDPMPGSPWDAAHATMWIRSPEFKLDDSGPLAVFLTGGNASGWNPIAHPMGSVADVPADSAVDGFMGIALRRVEDNTFVLVKTMPGDNNAFGWTATTMTQAELAPYANDGKSYTLEFIDSFHGSWPFQGMDTVGIPGTLVSEPSSAFETWAASQITAIDPGAAAGFGDDPDGDGIANGLEWILGGNPLAQDAAGLVTPQGEAATGLTLEFTRAKDSLAETTLVVQWDTGLDGSWPGQVVIGATSSGPEANGVTVTIDDTGSPDLVTVLIPASNAPAGRIFARLRATLNP